MKKLIFSLCLLCFAACGENTFEKDRLKHESGFARGADISWCTEMEADGRKFYNSAGKSTDIFVLMKELGMTAIRLRVWVNPAAYGSWCDKADVVAKAKRARAQGLDLMIDFHFSDFFADPGRQYLPVDWSGYSKANVKTALADHTKDVLQALKNEGIEPKWVQVGNETDNGMAFPHGRINWNSESDRFADYVQLSNAGYDAVKSVFPKAAVIIHLGIAGNARWFFSDFKDAGGKFDMIGLSYYPSDIYNNADIQELVRGTADLSGVPVMICETGFDCNQPELASEIMADLFERMDEIPRCAGIFYWEPEVDGKWKPSCYDKLGWAPYDKGAFTTGGQPTKALDAFGAGQTSVHHR